MDWNNIININEAKVEDVPSEGAYQGGGAELSKPMGAKKLGYHLEFLRPGMFSCPYHWHHSEEELFLVLEGEATLRQDDNYRVVKKGDLIFFSNNKESAHQFYNHSKSNFRFIALSTKDDFEICEYPDSKKILVRKADKILMSETNQDYWEGEQNPKEFWDQSKLT